MAPGHGARLRLCHGLFLCRCLFLHFEEAADSIQRAGFAKDDHAFEERRGHGASGDDGSEQHEVFLDRPLLLFA